MNVRSVLGMLAVMAAATPVYAAEKVEINVVNNRKEPIVMRFDYAFREYKWKLMEYTIGATDEITYRFPANIPGCEKLREWRITDGLLTLSNRQGPVCQKRISLCDKFAMTMEVGETNCKWSVN